MDKGSLITNIARTLASKSLQKGERRFLQGLHVRLVTLHDQAVIFGDERVRVLAIVSANA